MKSIASVLRPTVAKDGPHGRQEKPGINLLMGIPLTILGIGLLVMLAIQRESIQVGLASLHHKIGLAFIGLVPLTVLTAYLVISVVAAGGKISASNLKQLDFVEGFSQLLAGFATVDSLRIGVSSLTMNQGADGLLQALPELAGAVYIMALSNCWAILLTMAVVLLKWLGTNDDPEAAPVQAHIDPLPPARNAEPKKETRYLRRWQRSSSK